LLHCKTTFFIVNKAHQEQSIAAEAMDGDWKGDTLRNSSSHYPTN